MTSSGFFCFLKPFIKKINKFKERLHFWNKNTGKQMGDKYINWELGIERPFYLSKKFSIHQSITITGFQSAHGNSWPIKYSIVKISYLGTSIKYFDSVIFSGDYLENEFKHTFHVPNGSDYQLEIFNYYQYHTCGKLQILQNDNELTDTEKNPNKLQHSANF